jgi:quinol monooxygenase YgiN
VTLAKIVRIRVSEDAISELDGVLAAAASAFDGEPGTLQWVALIGMEPGERVLVELFRDQAAAAEHDRSAAVQTLLAEFARLSVHVVSVEERSTERAPATPLAGE